MRVRDFRGLAAFLLAIFGLAFASALARADQSQHELTAEACQLPSLAALDSLLAGWRDAINSYHPDVATRLFEHDAVLDGHYRHGVRSGYDQIRDYFVYFLYARPKADFSALNAERHCGLAAFDGPIVWHVGPPGLPRAGSVAVEVSILFAETPDGWRIRHYAETGVEEEALDGKAAAKGTGNGLVAGYVRRAIGQSGGRDSAGRAGAGPVPRAIARRSARKRAPLVGSPASGIVPGRFVGDVPVFD